MKPIWMVLLGALLGATVAEDRPTSGAVFGAVMGWLLARQIAQGREIDALRQRLQDGANAMAAEAPVVAPAPSVPAQQRPAAWPSPQVLADPAPVALSAADSAPPAIHPPRDLLDALPPALRAWLVGGNPILKLGIGVLFVGLAFLAKYASEHVSLPVELRLGGIGVVALVMLALGWRLRERRPVHAQVLQGGAVATLYLTLYAATRYFGLMPVGTAFAGMVGVATLAAVLALRQRAEPLALVGALGGFATPLLLQTGSGDARLLFGYFLVLDLGIAAVAWRLRSRALNLVGFLATFVIATAWGLLSYTPADRPWAQVFLLAYFVLFDVVVRVTALARRPLDREGDAAPARHHRLDAPLVFGLPAITFVLQAGLVRDIAHGAAFSVLALGLFHLAQAFWMQRRLASSTSHAAAGRLLAQADAAIGAVALTLAIPLALDASQTAGIWALEGAGAFWLGLRQQGRLSRAFGLLLIGLSGPVLVHAGLDAPATTSAIDAVFLNALLVAAGAGLAAWLAFRAGHRAEPVLILGATLWLAAAAAWQLDRHVPHAALQGGLLLALGLITALAVGLGRTLSWPGAARVALAQAPLLGLLALACWVDGADPLRDGGNWGWPVAWLVHGLVLHIGLKAMHPDGAAPATTRSPWTDLARATHLVGALALVLLGSALGHAVSAPWGPADSAWPWLGWGLLPVGLLGWKVLADRRSADRAWPLRLDPPAYRDAAGGLALGLLAWAGLANALSDGSLSPTWPAALASLPLLNPLDALIGLALWAAGTRWPAVVPGRAAWVGASAFVWLNAMLLRAFHQHAGVAYTPQAWAESQAVQTGLTLLWTATALGLSWWASRRGLRPLWAVGAALLGVVMLKLLAVDLSASGTVTRIVSFIGVGLLMLVIGFVAPWPSRPDDEARPSS